MSDFLEDKNSPVTWEAPGGFSSEVPEVLDNSGLTQEKNLPCGKKSPSILLSLKGENPDEEAFSEYSKEKSAGEAVDPPFVGTWESSRGFYCPD